MASSLPKNLRCAIYTRKSTEHGLELEFNSLDAQRDACEAYIKSQASQGWKALPQHYDDPAFSGGNLERPALKRLLADIEARKVDVVVVYKIDRLTRSLADFAKLVEAFDARSISFVAVTQQFNTTSSMGRLTLNVLLSFAQFERELSSERVRDKVAASRRKGKWTGGTVPLGYVARDKKLVIEPKEAETVRTIFKRYLELQSFSRVVADLNARGIVTKRRDTKVAKYLGGIPFTYGPLAHFLKNRIYLGEIGHGGKWFKGEHKPIIDCKTFDQVQEMLATNATKRKIKRSESGALLGGKLYDDRGNRMSPSFSVKNGIRYRYYVSSALLRGRKDRVGSVVRVSAQKLEATVQSRLRIELGSSAETASQADVFDRIDRVVLKKDAIEVTIRTSMHHNVEDNTRLRTFSIVREPTAKSIPAQIVKTDPTPDPKLLQSVVRAYKWIRQLTNGTCSSIEALAAAEKLHPKIVRQALRFAFLSPDLIQVIIEGRQSPGLSLARIPKVLSLSWCQQHQSVGHT